MKKILFAAVLASVTVLEAATVKFAKTAVTVKETAAYAELTVNKSGKEAARVRYATVSGTARPGSEYYAASGVLEWKDGDTKAKKISVRLMPDEVPVFEADKTFSVSLRACEADELEEGETVAKVETPSAVVTVAESCKADSGTVVVAGYYDSDDVWCAIENAKKPVLTMFKNGDGGLAALSLVRTGGSQGAVKVTVTAAPATARIGQDFTLAADPDVTNGVTSVEWKDGETGEKLVRLAAIDDEGIDGVYSRTASLRIACTKDPFFQKVKLGASSVSLVIRNYNVFESLAEFNSRIKGCGVSVSGNGWYASTDGMELWSQPVGKGKKTTLSVKCAGPGFFATYGAFEASGDKEGDFSWKCGKREGRADDDVELVLPSGSSTVSFTYESPKEATEDIALIGSFAEENMPFTWISFADVKPLPGDKAVLPVADAAVLVWTADERVTDYEDEMGLHYRVRLSDSKSVDKSPLFETNVVRSRVTLPEGILKTGATYYWRVDYLHGFDASDEQMVATGKSVWSFTTTGGDAPRVNVTGFDARGGAVTNGAVTLHQGVRVDWTLGASGSSADAKFSVVSGKLPTGLKIAKDSKSKLWKLAGVPVEAGTFKAVIGGTAGKTACETVALTFTVDAIGQAAGTFTAIVRDEGNCVEMASRRMALVNFTAGENGRLSAKVQLGGKSYSFLDTGYATSEQAEESTDEDVTADKYDYYLTAVLVNVTKSGKEAYTNELVVTVRDALLTNLDALGAAAGTVSLRMCVPGADGKTLQTDADGRGLPFGGTLYRDNSANAKVSAALADFAGYYTLALFPEPGASEDAPSGNGYLTVAVDASGKAKISGKLADGTAVSATAVGGFEGLLTDWAGLRTYRLVLPLLQAKGTVFFGGELALEWSQETGLVLVDSDAELVWVNDSATAMYDTAADEWSGFACSLSPVGGWYDTVCNLQSHYRRAALSVETEDGASVPVELENDKVVLSAANGLTVKLARATGIVTGNAVLTDGYTGKSAKVSHAGVLLMNYQLDTAEGIWSAGSAVFSRKVGGKTVKVAKPFNILAEDVDPDFAAGDEGDWEGE